MRIRDDTGDVLNYRGQTSGASVGTVMLEFPSLTGRNLTLPSRVATPGSTTPGGAPSGFLRYRDDAFAVDFTLPADLPVTGATAAVLSLLVQDLADMLLDGDPATAVDWASGHWVRLEDALGAESDVGGTDCSFTPFVASQDGTAPPAGAAVCAAATPSPPPPPPPATASFRRRRGWKLRPRRGRARDVAAAAACPRRRRAIHVARDPAAHPPARMTHGLTLITTIAAGFGLALILGFIAVRLRLPALVGYLVAGISSARPRRASSPISSSPASSPRSA